MGVSYVIEAVGGCHNERVKMVHKIGGNING